MEGLVRGRALSTVFPHSAVANMALPEEPFHFLSRTAAFSLPPPISSPAALPHPFVVALQALFEHLNASFLIFFTLSQSSYI